MYITHLYGTHIGSISWVRSPVEEIRPPGGTRLGGQPTLGTPQVPLQCTKVERSPQAHCWAQAPCHTSVRVRRPSNLAAQLQSMCVRQDIICLGLLPTLTKAKVDLSHLKIIFHFQNAILPCARHTSLCPKAGAKNS